MSFNKLIDSDQRFVILAEAADFHSIEDIIEDVSDQALKIARIKIQSVLKGIDDHSTDDAQWFVRTNELVESQLSKRGVHIETKKTTSKKRKF